MQLPTQNGRNLSGGVCMLLSKYTRSGSEVPRPAERGRFRGGVTLVPDLVYSGCSEVGLVGGVARRLRSSLAQVLRATPSYLSPRGPISVQYAIKPLEAVGSLFAPNNCSEKR